MDVDMELDQDLMQRFSSMGTTDKDVLIREFQKLAGNHLNPSACAFFLDMNNWNLQAAIGSYYDIETPIAHMKPPAMTFIQDITIGEGESVPPDTDFVKTWRVQNTGDESWPAGVYLRFIQGHQLGGQERVQVESLIAQCVTDISIQMHSPPQCGLYQGQWRMCTETGCFFGETIWVILEVKEGGMLGLTQQLSMSSLGLGSPPPTAGTSPNPFGSPSKHSTQSASLGSPFSSPSNSPGLVQFSNQAPSPNHRQSLENGISTHIRRPLFQVPENTPSESNPHPGQSPLSLSSPQALHYPQQETMVSSQHIHQPAALSVQSMEQLQLGQSTHSEACNSQLSLHSQGFQSS